MNTEKTIVCFHIGRGGRDNVEEAKKLLIENFERTDLI